MLKLLASLFLILFLLTTCGEEMINLNRVDEQWRLVQVTMTTASHCEFPPEEYSPPHGLLYDGLLSLNESVDGGTIVSLSNETFIIHRNKTAIATGISTFVGDSLFWKDEDEHLAFKFVTHTADSLVLKTRGNEEFRDITMVFAKR